MGRGEYEVKAKTKAKAKTSKINELNALAMIACKERTIKRQGRVLEQ